MEGQVITMQDIFRFEQTGIDGEGRVRGHFRSTGIRPRFAERFESLGIPWPRISSRESQPDMDLIALVAAATVMGAVVFGLIGLYQLDGKPAQHHGAPSGHACWARARAYEATAADFEALRPAKVGKTPIISSLLQGKAWTAQIADEPGARRHQADGFRVRRRARLRRHVRDASCR